MFTDKDFKKPLLPAKIFYRRLFNNSLIGLVTILISLFIGVAGYTVFAHLDLVDALLNASMILSGMGPVDTMHTTAAKIFSSCYALFSGVVFLSTIAVLFAPVLHRILHKFHLRSDDDE